MGYLICQRCGGYYKLREGESPDDFVSCQCYGPLKYVENLDDELVNKKKLSKGSYFHDDVIDVSELAHSHEVASSDDIVSPDDGVPSNGVKSFNSLDETSESSENLRSDKNKKFIKDLESVEDLISGEPEGNEFHEGRADDSFVSDEIAKKSNDLEVHEGSKSKKSELDSESDGLDSQLEGLDSQSESDERSPSNHLEEIEETESKSIADVYSNYLSKEPRIKNRAYYRQAYYGDTKPDINKYKLLRDVDSLIRSLKYPDHEIKQEAVQALGVIGDQSALKPLEEFMKVEPSKLKIYAEISVNQIKSKEYGSKSKNRNYYRDIYSSQNVKPQKKIREETYDNENQIKNDHVSKILTQISSPNDVGPKKFPQFSIKSNTIKLKQETELKTLDNGNQTPESPEQSPEQSPELSISKNKIKSTIPILKTPEGIFSKEKSLDTDLATRNIDERNDSDGDSLDTVSEKDTVSMSETSDSDLVGEGVSKEESLENNIVRDIGSEESSLVTHLEEDDVSEGESLRSDDELNRIPEVNSLESNHGEDSLPESNYLGRDIQEDVVSDELLVEQPSDISEQSIEQITTKELTIDVSPDIPSGGKNKTIENIDKKQPPLTQSKLRGFSDNKSTVSTNVGKPIRIREIEGVKKEITSKTVPSQNNTSVKNVNKGMGTTTKEDEENIYFIKWLGIKNSDKSLIGFIILFALSLIIGVVLTMGYK